MASISGIGTVSRAGSNDTETVYFSAGELIPKGWGVEFDTATVT